MRKACISFILCAVLLMPLIAVAENVVEILPTAAPMPKLVTEENPYAFTDLSVYFETYDWEYQTPSLTASEKERLPEAQRRWDDGERPESSVLNLTDNVKLSLVQLPMEQYEGESWFLFLPNRDLTDEEMLQLVDAFEQLDIRFAADMVTWHNCMRGGYVETLRSFTGDERERYSAIGSLFIRSGLRPETPFTLSVIDDGIGMVRLDEEAYNGLDEYRFYPARRLTDEELLQIYAGTHDEPLGSPEDLAAYEALLRDELHLMLGMPLSAKRSNEENVSRANSGNVFGDTRMVYRTGFTEVGGEGRTWSGAVDIATGKLVAGSVSLDDRYYTDDHMYSDIRMDPWDEHWAELAWDCVVSLNGSEEVSVVAVEAQCESNMNELRTAEIRLIMNDGGVYRAQAAFVLDKIMQVMYNDAVSMACEDNFYINIMTQEEAIINE